MIIIGVIITAIFFFLFEYLMLVPAGAYWSTYFFTGFFAALLICLIAYVKAGRRKNYNMSNLVLGLVITAYFGGAISISIINSPMFKAERYKNLLPAPNEKEFSTEIEPFDISKAPIVTISTAVQIADKTISQDGTIGSRAEMRSVTLQNVGGKLYYVAPLEHSGFFAWKNNNDKGTPFLMVNANNKECELVKANIRFQPGSYFGQDLARKLFFSKPGYGFTDFTFEVDDNKHPYWTASIYKNTIGLSGPVVTGVALVDAETGEVKIYGLKDAPGWIDRIQPEEFVINNINARGKYVRGFSPFNNNDKIKATEGSGIVYNEGKCYYYTGITSVGRDESSLGFYLVDTRTMEPTYFRLSGATETSAIRSAEGKVQNLGYNGSFPILMNIENKPTYFVPLQDKNDLTKLYSMVSVEDHTVLGTGESVEECRAAYLKALLSKNQLENAAGSQLEITGAVKRIGSYILQGSSYYTILLDTSDIIFTVPVNLSTRLPVTKEGDTIRIKYVDSRIDNSIAALGFENLSVK